MFSPLTHVAASPRRARQVDLAIALPVALVTGPAVAGGAAERSTDPVTATPSVTSAVVDEEVPLSGTAPAGARLRVEQRIKTGWIRVGEVTTAGDDGTYEMLAPTGWYGERRTRVSAKGASKGSSAAFDFEVTPELEPEGRRKDWSFLFPDHKHRYDPCTPIRWRYNAKGGFKGDMAMLEEALLEVERATGLDFEYLGRTKKKAFSGRQTSHANMVIDWQTPKENPALKGGTVGRGGFASRRGEIMAGDVILDSSEQFDGKDDFYVDGDGNSLTSDEMNAAFWHNIVMHEVGHAIGLGHAKSRKQVMAGSNGAYHWGKGDLSGLEKVGATPGCIKGSMRAESDARGKGAGRRGAAGPDATGSHVTGPSARPGGAGASQTGHVVDFEGAVLLP